MAEAKSGDLKRVIGFWGGTAVIIGCTIGSGIFRKPFTLARDLHDPVAIMGLWTFFGVISLFGALALAELCSMLPRTGGAYVFLRAAYGDSAAFVFGWLYLLVTAPAGIGALATFFAELLLGLFNMDPGQASRYLMPGIAGGTVILLSIANLLGAKLGSAIQSLFTCLKVGALLLIIVMSLLFTHGSFGHLANREGTKIAFGTLGMGVASVIWAYDGWMTVSFIAGEVVGAERLMKRIIVVGILAIVALYVVANVGYFYTMSAEAMSKEPGGVPQKIMSNLFGRPGAVLISAGIMCSVFGALNGNVLAKPRVAYALSRDGLTFEFLGRAHPRWATPYWAINIQAAVAVILIAFLKDFDKLTTYFVVVEWFALLFSVGAVFVLRRKMPHVDRPFRTPGYPWVPLLFLVGTLVGLIAIIWGEVQNKNYSPLWGLLIAVAGFPVYWIWRRIAKRETAPIA
jgi:APA family basic amino acid/polyamine antiporter